MSQAITCSLPCVDWHELSIPSRACKIVAMALGSILLLTGILIAAGVISLQGLNEQGCFSS